MTDLSGAGARTAFIRLGGGRDLLPRQRECLIALGSGKLFRRGGIEGYSWVTADGRRFRSVTMLALVSRGYARLCERRRRHVFAQITQRGRDNVDWSQTAEFAPR